MLNIVIVIRMNLHSSIMKMINSEYVAIFLVKFFFAEHCSAACKQH